MWRATAAACRILAHSQRLTGHQVRCMSSSAGKEKIGFLGVGNMGFHMAHNLHKRGKEVCAFDVSKEALEKVAGFGGSVASSPAQAAEGASYVITMLPSNQHVLDAYMGADGILSSLPEGSLCIDSR